MHSSLPVYVLPSWLYLATWDLHLSDAFLSGVVAFAISRLAPLVPFSPSAGVRGTRVGILVQSLHWQSQHMLMAVGATD